MANIGKLLKDEIARLGRKEARSETSLLKKQSAQYRRDIAVLKRQVADLSRKVTYFQKQEKKRVHEGPAAAPKGARFRADGLKSHRERLGLSAADYAKLVGCSALSIYHWESGKSKPRDEQLAKLVEVRRLGVREAHQRLEMLEGE
ncbi:MAG: helix-turn-helix transcriptional regulator [Phycisphaeraceae bacterium]|nr:helix-turn-helix transcriptional regulator [Phycisphaeraceae bacterium]